MASLARKGLITIELAALVLIVPIQAAAAADGISTTRPLSDAGFVVRPEVTTTRPLSDAGFEPVVTGARSVAHDAADPARSTDVPAIVWTTIALATLVGAVSVAMLGRRRRGMSAA
jgi:hypothetical protein